MRVDSGGCRSPDFERRDLLGDARLHLALEIDEFTIRLESGEQLVRVDTEEPAHLLRHPERLLDLGGIGPNALRLYRHRKGLPVPVVDLAPLWGEVPGDETLVEALAGEIGRLDDLNLE